MASLKGNGGISGVSRISAGRFRSLPNIDFTPALGALACRALADVRVGTR
jgi:hypothetical protein